MSWNSISIGTRPLSCHPTKCSCCVVFFVYLQTFCELSHDGHEMNNNLTLVVRINWTPLKLSIRTFNLDNFSTSFSSALALPVDASRCALGISPAVAYIVVMAAVWIQMNKWSKRNLALKFERVFFLVGITQRMHCARIKIILSTIKYSQEREPRKTDICNA